MPSKYAEKLNSTIRGSGLVIANTIAHALIEKACESMDRDDEASVKASRAIYDFAGTAKISDIKITIGDHEIPLSEILDKIEDHYVNKIDTEIAEGVKDVVFAAGLDKVQDTIERLNDTVARMKEELNHDVGHKVQEILGPDSYWAESSGTC